MITNELKIMQACCPACGEKIPLIQGMGISLLNNTISCPHCKRLLTVNKAILLLPVLGYVLIFPILSFTFSRGHYFLGPLSLILLISIILLIQYTAKYKVFSYKTESML